MSFNDTTPTDCVPDDIDEDDGWIKVVAKNAGQSTFGNTYERLCAARTASAKKKNGPLREGAKKAKKM